MNDISKFEPQSCLAQSALGYYAYRLFFDFTALRHIIIQQDQIVSPVIKLVGAFSLQLVCLSTGGLLVTPNRVPEVSIIQDYA